MRDGQIIRGFENQDESINRLRHELMTLQKIVDKTYYSNLTHVMMWDTLLGLLSAKGMVTKEQFDAALKKLSDDTKAAMEAEEKAKEGEEKIEGGTVKVLSQEPAIPVTAKP